MKCVYEAATVLDAHMILNLLEQEDVVGRVDGEYLPGAVGEIPVSNMVRVMVEEVDYERAGKIIREWEAIEVPSEKSVRPPASGIPAFIAGLLLGGAAVFWAYNSSVTQDGVDLDGDGELDERWFYRDYLITRTEIDKNFDHKVDVVLYYDHRELLKRAESDLNFDGVYETETLYKNGQLISERSDFNQDGNVDYTVAFKYDLIDEIEIAGEAEDVRVKRQKYRLGKLISAELDTDGDGVFDIEYKYDELEEVKRKIDKRFDLGAAASSE